MIRCARKATLDRYGGCCQEVVSIEADVWRWACLVYGDHANASGGCCDRNLGLGQARSVENASEHHHLIEIANIIEDAQNCSIVCYTQIHNVKIVLYPRSSPLSSCMQLSARTPAMHRF
jgi:hypothetical protein